MRFIVYPLKGAIISHNNTNTVLIMGMSEPVPDGEAIGAGVGIWDCRSLSGNGCELSSRDGKSIYVDKAGFIIITPKPQ